MPQTRQLRFPLGRLQHRPRDPGGQIGFVNDLPAAPRNSAVVAARKFEIQKIPSIGVKVGCWVRSHTRKTSKEMSENEVMAAVNIAANLIKPEDLLEFVSSLKRVALSNAMVHVNTVNDFEFSDLEQETAFALSLNSVCHFMAIEKKLFNSIARKQESP